ncbi:hypothetical protein FOA52_002889 [Chlamydomonas sp. UWO 241]|nr:hypothetical protein FOA52_002889 [Chlamydomonas sp. UWO 241]
MWPAALRACRSQGWARSWQAQGGCCSGASRARFSTEPTPPEAPSSSGSSVPIDVRVGLASQLSLHFKDDAFGTAKVIAASLSPAMRVVLAATIREKHIQPDQADDTLDELYRAASSEDGHLNISKGKFRDVILSHSKLSMPQGPPGPSKQALLMLFLASAIPFTVFGFLDNFIMLSVGEEIDAVFGVRFGLTTLASAGLGNCVADVTGVGAAKAIENAVKRLPFIKMPKLTSEQYNHTSVRSAKSTGAILGVLIGCVLGILPLAMQGNFYMHP